MVKELSAQTCLVATSARVPMATTVDQHRLMVVWTLMSVRQVARSHFVVTKQVVSTHPVATSVSAHLVIRAILESLVSVGHTHTHIVVAVTCCQTLIIYYSKTFTHFHVAICYLEKISTNVHTLAVQTRPVQIHLAVIHALVEPAFLAIHISRQVVRVSVI